MNTILSGIKSHKIIIVTVALVVILFTAVSLWLQQSNASAVSEVKQEDLVNTILINGTYTTASQTQVISPTKGIIEKLYVKNGDQVKKGDKLFHVASTASQDEITKAYADYQVAITDLTIAQNTLRDKEAIVEKTKDDLKDHQKDETFAQKVTRTTAEVAKDNAFDGVKAAQAKLDKAKLTYTETQSALVTAQAAGTITNLAAKVNDQVATTDSTVLLITDFSNPVMVSAVDQVNIPKLKVGQKAAVVFDALPEQTFTAAIRDIDTIGTKTQGTTTFNVYITADNLPSVIQPNMTASITIETERKNNALTVPNEAIVKKDGKTFVKLAKNSKNSLTEVSVGLKGLTKIEIFGLSIGDLVEIPK